MGAERERDRICVDIHGGADFGIVSLVLSS
jgi:hypothetical protein